MLVLSRKTDETIIVTTPSGEAIKVVVVEIQGSNKVRLGIDAPAAVTIHRSEVADRIAAGESLAAAPGDGTGAVTVIAPKLPHPS